MDRALELVKELMEELQGQMAPGAEDFGERLGRPKPSVEIEVASEEPMMEGDEMLGDEMDEEMGPDEKLKARLLKLRG